MNFVIIGRFTGDIEEDRAAFREVENSLADLGHGVLNPARLPSDLSIDERHHIVEAYIDVADCAYLLPDAFHIDAIGHADAGICKGEDLNLREEIAEALTRGLPIYTEHDLVAYDDLGPDGAGGRLLFEAGRKKLLYDRYKKKTVKVRTTGGKVCGC